MVTDYGAEAGICSGHFLDSPNWRDSSLFLCEMSTAWDVIKND
jgi:hypothetical protein